MKNFIGNVLILIGIFLMFYVAGYLMLFCGIVGVVDNLDPINSKAIALNIIKIILFELGSIPGLIVFGLGTVIKD